MLCQSPDRRECRPCAAPPSCSPLILVAWRVQRVRRPGADAGARHDRPRSGPRRPRRRHCPSPRSSPPATSPPATPIGDEATAALLDARPNALIATLGDNVYESGTAAEFANCYDPTWGRHKGRTRPALGNHEYGVFRAGGYFGAFGAAAGEAPPRLVQLRPGRLARHRPELQLRGRGLRHRRYPGALARAGHGCQPGVCTLAIWHHPRWSVGDRPTGPRRPSAPLYQALHDAGADVLLSGHEHNYERFAPLDPAGNFDPARGVRQFVVGTGGRSHYPFGPPQHGSQVRNDNTFGLLALTLRANSYDWQFVPEAGKTFTDAGSGQLPLTPLLELAAPTPMGG